DLERHLRDVGVLEPLEAAREAVAVDRLALQVGLHRRQVALEARHGILALADALHRGIAAADAEDRPAAALHLESERRGGRDGGGPRDRVGDARAETDARCGLRREHEL